MLAAASYLSVSDFRRAIVTLIRANELYLAYHIAKLFYPLALRETALLLCEKLEKYFQGELCLRLLESEVGECKLQKKRLANMGLIKLPQDESAKYEALAKNNVENPLKSIEYYLIAGKVEEACKIVVELLSYGQSPQIFEITELI